MALVGMGVVYVTSRVEVSKRDMSVQDIAVTQMRNLLIQNGNGTINLCDNASHTITVPGEANNSVALSISGCTAANSGTVVNGVTVTGFTSPLTLSATTTKLGTISVGGTSNAQ